MQARASAFSAAAEVVTERTLHWAALSRCSSRWLLLLVVLLLGVLLLQHGHQQLAVGVLCLHVSTV